MINYVEIGIIIRSKKFGSTTAWYAFKNYKDADKSWNELREVARKIEFKYSGIERTKRTTKDLSK